MSTTRDPVTSFLGGLVKNPGKSAEKGLLYIGGLLSATNVFGAGSMDQSLRTWITASIALILAGLHISTATPKSGPNQT
jgi:hypothetical protein